LQINNALEAWKMTNSGMPRDIGFIAP